MMAARLTNSKRIAIVNVWGTNRGDEAMQRSLIHALLSEGSELEIAVFAQSPVDLPKNVVSYSWDDLPHQYLPVTPRQLFRYLRRVSDRSTSVLEKRSRARTFLYSSDLIISGPAGPYIGDTYPEYELSCLANIAFSSRRGIPCVITATSAGPFRNKTRNVRRRQILSKIAWWTIREPISYSAVSEIAPSVLDYELTTDMVFSNSVDLKRLVTSNFEQQDIDELLRFASSPTIGITLNTTDYIDESATTHRFDVDRYVQDMSIFLDKVVQSTGARLLFFPHHYGSLYEMNLIKEVASSVAPATLVRIVPPYLNSDVQRAVISQLELYISHRYHPTIFALQQAVPVFCIVHQFKTQGLLQQFKYPVVMPNTLSPVSEWLSSFSQLWEKRSEVKSHIEAQLPVVSSLANVTVKRLFSTLRTL